MKKICNDTYAISPRPLSLSNVIPIFTSNSLVDLIGTFKLNDVSEVFTTFTLNSTAIVVCVNVIGK